MAHETPPIFLTTSRPEHGARAVQTRRLFLNKHAGQLVTTQFGHHRTLVTVMTAGPLLRACVTFVQNPVSIAVIADFFGNVANIGDEVVIAVGLAIVGHAVLIAVVLITPRNLAYIRNVVVVAVRGIDPTL
jgi:sensor c-di-GMP phosphodiesterase-like protein